MEQFYLSNMLACSYVVSHHHQFLPPQIAADNVVVYVLLPQPAPADEILPARVVLL